PVPAVRARDRGVRLLARDRLRRRGVSARRREHPAPVQGGDEPAGGHVARDEGTVLPRLPRSRRTAVPRRGRGRPPSVRELWPTDDRSILRVLPRAGADPRPAARGPRVAGRGSRTRRRALRGGSARRALRRGGPQGRRVTGPFEPGERILLIDQRERRYLLRLAPGETWQWHCCGL